MKNSYKGFTLVELIIVIAIIGILSSVVLANLNTARTKARDVTRKANVDQMLKGITLFFTEKGNLPGNIQGTCATVSDAVFGPVFATDLQPYLRTIQLDPTKANQAGDYLFSNINNGNGHFEVCANMEIPSAGNGVFDHTACAGGIVYNYCVNI